MVLLMAEECSSEVAVPEEIHILFDTDDISADPVKGIGDLLWKSARHHCRKLSLSEVLHAVFFRPFNKLVKIEWRVRFFHILVKQIPVSALTNYFYLLFQKRT